MNSTLGMMADILGSAIGSGVSSGVKQVAKYAGKEYFKLMKYVDDKTDVLREKPWLRDIIDKVIAAI